LRPKSTGWQRLPCPEMKWNRNTINHLAYGIKLCYLPPDPCVF